MLKNINLPQDMKPFFTKGPIKLKLTNPKILRHLASFLAVALSLVACGGGDGFGVGVGKLTPFGGTKQMGVAGVNTGGYSTATDANGNVYVAGVTDGGLDGNTLMGTSDFYLTKYDATGTRLYTKQMGVAGALTSGNSVTTDASGNVYATGVTFGGLDGNTLTGISDFFLTKYDSTGTKLYTKQLGAVGADTNGESVATDANGNVYVTGQTLGGLDGNNLIGTIFDAFLTKYNASGTKLYTKQIGVTGTDTYGASVATDSNGSVYVTGQISGGLGTADCFLIKYDVSGTGLYAKQLGVAGAHTEGQSTATDASGNVYVAGSTQGNLDGNTLKGTTDFFLTKYDANGAKLYTKQMGVAGKDTYGSSTATDASGNVYVTGRTQGGLDGNTLKGITDLFLTKYDASGDKLYTKQMGVAGAYTSGNSTATDVYGNVFVTGSTNGGLDGNTLTGTSDFFLMKYNSAGTKQ
jgi:hypothetical protein